MVASVTDSGYAWTIPLACCYINAVLFGIYRSYGILYRVLLESFHVSRSTASWPFSLCMTVIHLTGPISGALNLYLTTRMVMFFGCVLATVGVGLCYTATTVQEIILHIGVIQGFGIGLTYVQNNAIINEYFVKFRATANGISLAGGTIGAFCLSYLMEGALNYFNLQECFLILATISLTTLPICLLLKPFKEKEADNQLNHYNRAMALASTVYLRSYNANGQQFKGSNGISPLPGNFGRRESSISRPVKSIGKLIAGQLLNMERKVSFASGDEMQVTTTDPGHQDQATDRKVSTAMSPPPVSPVAEPISTLTCIVTILKNPYFILTALTHMAYFWSSITFMMIIVDYSDDKKIPVHNSIHLINAFSGGDLVGRLGSGWLMDNKMIPLKYLALVSSFGIGMLLQLTTISSDFYVLVAISGALGLLSGLVNILLNILFCKYLGTKNASLAFGLSAFFCGLVTLARPMVVGYFRDGGGSYDGLLLVLGFVSSAAGCLWFLEPCFSRSKFVELDDDPWPVNLTVNVQEVLRGPVTTVSGQLKK